MKDGQVGRWKRRAAVWAMVLAWLAASASMAADELGSVVDDVLPRVNPNEGEPGDQVVADENQDPRVDLLPYEILGEAGLEEIERPETSEFGRTNLD